MAAGGTRSFYEGCLSVEGYQAVRKRWLDIVAHWHDEDAHRLDEFVQRVLAQLPVVLHALRAQHRLAGLDDRQYAVVGGFEQPSCRSSSSMCRM